VALVLPQPAWEERRRCESLATKLGPKKGRKGKVKDFPLREEEKKQGHAYIWHNNQAQKKRKVGSRGACRTFQEREGKSRLGLSFYVE